MTKDEILAYISANYAEALENVGVQLENSQRHLFYVIDDAFHGETPDHQRAIADRETRKLIRDRSALFDIEPPTWPDEVTPPQLEDGVPDPIPASVLNEGQSPTPVLEGDEE